MSVNVVNLSTPLNLSALCFVNLLSDVCESFLPPLSGPKKPHTAWEDGLMWRSRPLSVCTRCARKDTRIILVNVVNLSTPSIFLRCAL